MKNNGRTKDSKPTMVVGGSKRDTILGTPPKKRGWARTKKKKSLHNIVWKKVADERSKPKPSSRGKGPKFKGRSYKA